MNSEIWYHLALFVPQSTLDTNSDLNIEFYNFISFIPQFSTIYQI